MRVTDEFSNHGIVINELILQTRNDTVNLVDSQLLLRFDGNVSIVEGILEHVSIVHRVEERVEEIFVNHQSFFLLVREIISSGEDGRGSNIGSFLGNVVIVEEHISFNHNLTASHGG